MTVKMENMSIKPATKHMVLGDPIRFAELLSSKSGMEISINSYAKDS
jgi:hypothetical protein